MASLETTEGGKRGKDREDRGPMMVSHFAQIVLVSAVVAAGIWVLWDFLSALLWAVIIAIATWPLYRRFQRLSWPREGGRLLIPICFTFLVAAVLVLPLVALAAEVGRETVTLIRSFAATERNGFPVPQIVTELPWIGDYLANWWQANLSDPSSVMDLVGRLNTHDLFGWARSLGGEVVHRLIGLFFTLMALFFLYRDGGDIARRVTALIDRLFGRVGVEVDEHLVATLRGTVNGLVLVGLGEGIVLGIAYAAVGLPQPGALAALTGLLAMVPFAAPVVFTAGALILLAQGSTVAAISLFVFGVIVMFIGDHFIRPVLIGGSAGLPFLWVLLGILGGIAGFGLVGLFLGPAIMAALITLWRDATTPLVKREAA